MVQSVLIFAFGFLAAAFLALAVGPAIWRRSAELTRKRIEASLPLTLNELQADKDQQRAEFAIAVRKVEAKNKSLQDRLTAQLADIAANRERARQFMAERDRFDRKALQIESELAATSRQLSDRNTDVVALNGTILELESQLQRTAAELGVREKTIVDLQMELDNRRIELAAQATETENLSGRVSEVTTVGKNLEEKLRAISTDYRAARESLRQAERKVVDGDKSNEKLATRLADREERLARRESELATLKDELRQTIAAKTSLEQQLQSTERLRNALEKQNTKMEERLTKLASMAVPGTAEKAMKKLQDDKARLMDMVERLTGEKNELVRKLKLATASSGNDEVLRESMHDLTAKVVAMTAEVEGARSPITKLLNNANESVGTADADGDNSESLAARIRSVQKAARLGS